MKIALTSDLHLRADKPERLEYFEALLAMLTSQKLSQLIIAGDLFDQGYSGYKALDAILAKYPQIKITAIPGNHDSDISQGQFASQNIRVLTKPTFVQGKQGYLSFLFLPYTSGATVSEVIEQSEVLPKSDRGPWILITHGDYGTRRPDENGNETGYFPLTRNDLDLYQPKRVVLGHIHKPGPESELVVYPGSPWPIDTNETGQRRILALDSMTGALDSLPLPFSPCYLDWPIFVIPDGDEVGRIRSALDTELAGWNEKIGKTKVTGPVSVSVEIGGCSVQRDQAEGVVRDWFTGKALSLESVSIERLHFVEEDKSRKLLTSEFEKSINDLALDQDQFPGGAQSMLELIHEYGLQIIYEIKE